MAQSTSPADHGVPLGRDRWRIVPVGVVVLMLVASWLQREIIWTTIVSLVLTVLHTVSHPSQIPRYWRVELVEYWIAALVWVGTIVGAIVFSLPARRWRGQRKKRITGLLACVESSAKTVQGRIGTCGALCFMFIAFVSPFLVPWSPYAQGDLTTTRFLKPLQWGVAWLYVPPLDSITEIQDPVERRLLEANNDLLNRTIYLTREPSEGDSALSSPRMTERPGRFHAVFLLGTDAIGRDVFSRVIYSTRVSLGIGVAAMAASVLIGALLGSIAGAFGGITDRILMRVVDIFLSIPSLFLAITIVAFLGRSILIVIIVLSATGWMGVARLVRGEVLKLREREFILAARLLGTSSFGIIRHHLLPNVLPIILVAAVLQLVNAILGEAALSFLGLGVQPPIPSWGNMIGEAMADLHLAWWNAIFPGLALSLLVFSAHLTAEGLQDQLQT